MKKILLTLILGIFFMSLASAQIQSLGTFKLGEDINLIQTCDNCTFNNITSVLSPNSQELIGEFIMTKTGTIYNFTFGAGNVTELGTYIVNGFGDLNGFDTVWNYNFLITQDGKESIVFPQQFSVIVLGIILIMFGILNPRYNLLKIMGSLVLMVMGVLTLYPGYNNISHSSLFGLALGSILVGIGFWFLIEDAFSRTKQTQRFNQDQGEEEEEFEEEEDNRQ